MLLVITWTKDKRFGLEGKQQQTRSEKHRVSSSAQAMGLLSWPQHTGSLAAFSYVRKTQTQKRWTTSAFRLTCKWQCDRASDTNRLQLQTAIQAEPVEMPKQYPWIRSSNLQFNMHYSENMRIVPMDGGGWHSRPTPSTTAALFSSNRPLWPMLTSRTLEGEWNSYRDTWKGLISFHGLIQSQSAQQTLSLNKFKICTVMCVSSTNCCIKYMHVGEMMSVRPSANVSPRTTVQISMKFDIGSSH
jgi:hypothetical protein